MGRRQLVLLGGNDDSTGNGLNGSVRALTVDGSGTVFAGGSFTIAYDATGSSVSANHVAQWDGADWSALGADARSTGNGVSAPVNALVVDGSSLYVGGCFHRRRHQQRQPVDANRVAAWNHRQQFWTALGAGTGMSGNGVNSTVNALVIAQRRP